MFEHGWLGGEPSRGTSTTYRWRANGWLHVQEDGSDGFRVFPLVNALLLEVWRVRKVVRKVAGELYVAEVHRQGVGWDDYCTDLLVRSQHALAVETKKA